MAPPRKQRDTMGLRPDEVAYTIKDKYFPDLEVRKTDNAWWVDRTKVDKVIYSFKNAGTIEQACVYAGITLRQYKYFVDVHPDFCTIHDACMELPNLMAKRNLVNALNDGDRRISQWWAERKMRKEFATRHEYGLGGVQTRSQVTEEEKNLIKQILKDNFDNDEED